MARRPSVAELRRGDTTILRVKDAFITLIGSDRGFESKEKILEAGDALGFITDFPWLSMILSVTKEKPWFLVVPLNRLMFYGPRALARQGKTPSQYIAKSIGEAYGFACATPFALLGDLHRQIVEKRYKKAELVAASAQHRASLYRDALPREGDLLGYDPAMAASGP